MASSIGTPLTLLPSVDNTTVPFEVQMKIFSSKVSSSIIASVGENSLFVTYEAKRRGGRKRESVRMMSKYLSYLGSGMMEIKTTKEREKKNKKRRREEKKRSEIGEQDDR
jgi:hypothetical protein